MIQEIEALSAADLGERLRIARETAKLTQMDAASRIDLSRTTLVAIEQGQRKVRLHELRSLASLYGTSVNALVRQKAVHLDLEPRFRKFTKATGAGIESAIELLSRLVRAEVELEDLLGVQRKSFFPLERPILLGDLRIQAEQDAQEIRQLLGVGSGPILSMVSFLEHHLGVRVYLRKLDARISGLSTFHEGVGACVLLNGSHPRARKDQTAAHEFAHLLTCRSQASIFSDSISNNPREERYADCFARCLLTPAIAVKKKFAEVTSGATRLTRRHVILLSHYFGVSREALVRRLEELELAKPGTWDWFLANGGITDVQARDVLGTDADSQVDWGARELELPLPSRICALATEVWSQELLSEGQLADLLKLNRVELRGILDEFSAEGGGSNALLELPQ